MSESAKENNQAPSVSVEQQRQLDEIDALLTDGYTGDDPFGFEREVLAFEKAFQAHFGDAEAKRYRAYHEIIGSTPSGSDRIDRFDADDEWSVVKRLEEIAQKHHIALPEA